MPNEHEHEINDHFCSSKVITSKVNNHYILKLSSAKRRRRLHEAIQKPHKDEIIQRKSRESCHEKQTDNEIWNSLEWQPLLTIAVL